MFLRACFANLRPNKYSKSEKLIEELKREVKKVLAKKIQNAINNLGKKAEFELAKKIVCHK